MKGILLNEEGDASLEDLSNSVTQGTTDYVLSVDPEGSNSNNKKVLLHLTLSVVFVCIKWMHILSVLLDHL